MPRARSQVIAIIEQLDETRENINRLNEILQEVRRVCYMRTRADHHVYAVDWRRCHFRPDTPN